MVLVLNIKGAYCISLDIGIIKFEFLARTQILGSLYKREELVSEECRSKFNLLYI